MTLSTYYTILKIEYELFNSVINPVVHKLTIIFLFIVKYWRNSYPHNLNSIMRRTGPGG
jgi:hypothetical protein